MKKLTSGGAALLLTTTAAYAGGIDRSGQSIGAIFEDGKYVELSYGSVMPTVSGSIAGGAVASGSAISDYNAFGLAFKTDIDDKVSVAVIVDQPFGADVAYNSAGYPLDGTNAQVESSSITVVGRYKFNENLSVHFGPRYLRASGNYDLYLGDPNIPIYASTYSSGSGTGFVAGAAYERTDIALRVALTYSSAIDLELDGTNGDLEARMPRSVNLDFQSGVAADTLVFGSVRWAEWSDAYITDTLFGSLVTWDEDTIAYTLGVGRKFSDSFSGAISVAYEGSDDLPQSNLGPTDGYTSVSVGGTYTLDNGIELTGGVRYIMVGDATTNVPTSATTTTPSDFSDNDAVAVGLKIAYTY